MFVLLKVSLMIERVFLPGPAGGVVLRHTRLSLLIYPCPDSKVQCSSLDDKHESGLCVGPRKYEGCGGETGEHGRLVETVNPSGQE